MSTIATYVCGVEERIRKIRPLCPICGRNLSVVPWGGKGARDTWRCEDCDVAQIHE